MASKESSSAEPSENFERQAVDSGEEEEEEEEEEDRWDDWSVAAAGDGGPSEEDAERVQCLFCAESRPSAAAIFDHCSELHSFDFVQLRRDRGLQFYDCLRLINFVRSEVAANGSGEALMALSRHLEVSQRAGSSSSSAEVDNQNAPLRAGGGELLGSLWSDEKYLTPFLPNDALLYTFDDGENEDFEDPSAGDYSTRGDESVLENLRDGGANLSAVEQEIDAPQVSEGSGEVAAFASQPEIAAHASALLAEEMSTEGAPDLEDEGLSDSDFQLDYGDEKVIDQSNGLDAGNTGSCATIPKKKTKGKVTFATVAAKEKLSINRSYFGSYSGFGIHREMLSDKVRTEAYQAAIMKNPSLVKDSVVMDVGCGTGILSLFAAKAGARKVIAVDGSEKMTAVATQVAKSNGLLDDTAGKEGERDGGGVICVVAGMIEELEATMPVPMNSVDVLVSEWMGYCLLFESMLGSVLYARDKWLKPGGAMLPDTASMFVAGFGKGGTSLSFWEDVYGFDMQCVGEEVVHDATQHPIIDVIPSKDVITDTCCLKEFDLTSMKHEDVDYTAEFGVKLLPSALDSSYEDDSLGLSGRTASLATGNAVKCYGLVVWFDTGFTDRFCKEQPINLTTSPHTPKTHWSQTLLTFKEPITLCTENSVLNHQNFERSRVGSDDFPAYSVIGRISIARSFRFRSIDISLEATASGAGGAMKSWPVQIFDI